MSREKRILLVDDEPVITKTLSKYLQMAGFSNVRSLNDPLLVEQEMKDFNPQLMLLDISMPGLDGLKILERLSDRVIDDSLTVLMVTSTEDDYMKRTALILGARDFISKPVDPDELVSRVDDAFAGKPNLEFLLHSLPQRGNMTDPNTTPPQQST